jgi:DNA-binding transcriptional ArsR family regulator
MELFERDRKRIKRDQAQALSHPVRLRILGLFTSDSDRPLAVDIVHANLIEDDEFSDVTVSQTGYHLARLTDAQLIPVSARDAR